MDLTLAPTRVTLRSTSTPEPAALHIVFVTGASPEKRFRRFRDRIPAALYTHVVDDPMSDLVNGTADMTLVRLESENSLPESLYYIWLYDEAWGVAFEKKYIFSLAESVPEGLLTDETVLLTSVDVGELRQILPAAATGVGVVVRSRTILKALSKKAAVSSNLVTGEGAIDPPSRIAIWLVQPKTEDDELRQEFIGIAQGCREGSTCTQLRRKKADEAPRKLSAREKTFAKQARRQHAGAVVKHARNDRGERRSSGGNG